MYCSKIHRYQYVINQGGHAIALVSMVTTPVKRVYIHGFSRAIPYATIARARGSKSIDIGAVDSQVSLSCLARLDFLAQLLGIAEKSTMGKKRWLECVQFNKT